jgi:hypothetical protein
LAVTEPKTGFDAWCENSDEEGLAKARPKRHQKTKGKQAPVPKCELDITDVGRTGHGAGCLAQAWRRNSLLIRDRSYGKGV